MLIGTVSKIEGNEILVAGSNIGEKVYIMDRLCIYTEKEMILLEAHFPMLTTSKCRVVKGSIKAVKPGMKVYKYKAD